MISENWAAMAHATAGEARHTTSDPELGRLAQSLEYLALALVEKIREDEKRMTELVELVRTRGR